jgi:hypothetical protein
LDNLNEARSALLLRNAHLSGEGLAVPWLELPEISPAAQICALPVTLEALSLAFHEVRFIDALFQSVWIIVSIILLGIFSYEFD